MLKVWYSALMDRIFIIADSSAQPGPKLRIVSDLVCLDLPVWSYAEEPTGKMRIPPLPYG